MTQFVAAATLGQVGAVWARGEFHLFAEHENSLHEGMFGNGADWVHESDQDGGRLGGEVVQVDLPMGGHTQRDH